MRVDDRDLSPATLDDYIDWVVNERLFMRREDFDRYSRLNTILINTEFIVLHPRDNNRADDGLTLREDFTYETGLYLDKSSGLMPVCTVFEMLVAFAYRCEDQIMLNLSEGYRPWRWWNIMLDNLGFLDLTDSNWRRDDVQIVEDTLDKFMNREYENNEIGCLFKIKNRDFVARDEELWKQCMVFINENYM